MRKRTSSAIVLLIITFGSILASEVSRVLFFAAAGVICCYELSRNLEKLDIACCAWVMYTHLAIQAVLTLLHAPLEYCVTRRCPVRAPSIPRRACPIPASSSCC